MWIQPDKHTVTHAHELPSMIPLSQTVRKFEHDRKCPAWWSFHQGEGKHLVGVTSLSADTNSTTGKYRLDSSWDGAMLPSNNNHFIIADYYLTSTWPVPPPPVPTCPTLLVTTCPGMRRDILGYSSTGWGWPGLVVTITVQAMTFLSAVGAKAKHPSAICPSRMEHNSGIETSASNDNHTDRQQCQGKSHTMTTVYHTEERGGWGRSS